MVDEVNTVLIPRGDHCILSLEDSSISRLVVLSQWLSSPRSINGYCLVVDCNPTMAQELIGHCVLL